MIRSISLSVIVVVLSGCAGAAPRAHPVLDTVRVAAPTGERAADRARVQAAFDAVRPGGTVAFAAGTYVIGGDGLVLRTPGVALIGHPASTTLQGCTREQRTGLEANEFSEACGDGFVLAVEAQRVSGLRFESFDDALSIREATEAEEQGRSAAFTGGHLVEDNSFHDGISFDISLDADSTVRVRRNVFRNVWHAVAIVGGRNIHVTENDVSVPEPEKVPHGFAGVAIGALADAAGACSSMIVEGNRIEGHTEAVGIAVFPHRLPGSACSDITIRDNEIVMRSVRRPDGRLAIAPAIRLFNAQRLVSESLIEWGEPPEGGWPDALSEGRISNVRVEGNRITGAVGIGIEAAHVTDTRIVDNEIEVRPATTPEELDGLSVGGNVSPGVWVLLGLVDEVNGTPVWVSPGSEGTVVRSPTGEPGTTHPATPMAAADAVNVAPPTGEKEDDRASILARAAVEKAIRAYLDAFAAQDPELIRNLVTEDFVVIENGYPLPLDRATEGMDPRRPLPMEYRFDDLQIEIGGDLAVYRFDLGWFLDGEQVDWGLETGHARRIGSEWKLAQNHMTFLPVRGDLPVATLRAYEGDYRGLDFQGREDLIRLYLGEGRLFMTRPDGRRLIGGILRLGMLPDPAGGFFVEVLNGRVEFEAGASGEVSGLTYIPPPEQHPDYRSPLRYEKVR